MNYLKALFEPRNRSLVTAPFKHFSTSDSSGFCHVPEESVFILKLPKGHAEVKYCKENGVLNLMHTNVPESYKGQGIGKRLAKDVLEYCLENNIKVKLTCDFLVEFSKKNQQFNNIIIPHN